MLQRIILVAVCFLLVGHVVVAQRACASYDYLQQELKNNPKLGAAMQHAENFLFIKRQQQMANALVKEGDAALPVITIPVVVHVLYNTDRQNISDAQILSQIDALNRDYRKQNADTVNIPDGYKHLAADCGIEFKLATVDPRGRATTGIVRRQTGIQFFGLDDRIKSTAIGGDDPWNPDQYLNIWIGSMAGGLLGYANPLGGPKEKDGVVLHYGAVGTVGMVSAPYDKGRTATHEVGHWLGLRHIWGDEYCGNDYVDDTPPQRSPSFKCPTGVIITCNNEPYGNMYMNYMDLTYDACINLFTIGQRDRMRSNFEPGGAHYALLSSNALGTPLPEPIELPVDSTETTGLRLYPNPVISTITIDISSDNRLLGKQITLFTPQGTPVLTTRINNTTQPLQLGHLKAGIYFLRIEGEKSARKIMKR